MTNYIDQKQESLKEINTLMNDVNSLVKELNQENTTQGVKLVTVVEDAENIEDNIKNGNQELV